jgi:hypothetical protein
MTTVLAPALIEASSWLIGLVVIAAALLRAWQGWLDLKRRELERGLPSRPGENSAGLGSARIELADLKERIRRGDQLEPAPIDPVGDPARSVGLALCHLARLHQARRTVRLIGHRANCPLPWDARLTRCAPCAAFPTSSKNTSFSMAMTATAC